MKRINVGDFFYCLSQSDDNGFIKTKCAFFIVEEATTHFVKLKSIGFKKQLDLYEPDINGKISVIQEYWNRSLINKRLKIRYSKDDGSAYVFTHHEIFRVYTEPVQILSYFYHFEREREVEVYNNEITEYAKTIVK